MSSTIRQRCFVVVLRSLNCFRLYNYCAVFDSVSLGGCDISKNNYLKAAAVLSDEQQDYEGQILVQHLTKPDNHKKRGVVMLVAQRFQPTRGASMRLYVRRSWNLLFFTTVSNGPTKTHRP